MTILQECGRTTKEIYDIDVDIKTLPVNDPYVYENIAKGYTQGVFQLEGKGMTSFMRKLFQDVSGKIKNIKKISENKEEEKINLAEFGNELYERLVAGISLYRPGPIGEIDNYLAGMLNPDKVTYIVPELEPILKNTYGILVYQEQVMLTVRNLAGFTKGQADTIRKAMSKKDNDLLQEYGDYFVYGSKERDTHYLEEERLNIKGCINKGINEKDALSIWDKMVSFGKYAFNKSHAAGYAKIAIFTGYFSHYYPAIFIKSNMNSYINNKDKIKAYLKDAFQRKFVVLPPSVSKSEGNFVATRDGGIRFGLTGVKSVKKTAAYIQEERLANGEFKSFEDFVSRLYYNYSLNSSALKNLIQTGALDEFEGTRKGKVLASDMILEKLKKAKAKQAKIHKDQLSMFDMPLEESDKTVLDSSMKFEIPNVKEYTTEEILKFERDITGFYISGHPLNEYLDVLLHEKIQDITHYTEEAEPEFTPSDDSDIDDDGIIENKDVSIEIKNVMLAGVISNFTSKITKNGKTYYEFELEDKSSSITCKLFKVEVAQGMIYDGGLVVLKGTYQNNNFGKSLIVNSVANLKTLSRKIKTIKLKGHEDREKAVYQWRKVKMLIFKYPGDTTVFFEKSGEIYNMGKINLTISLTNDLQKEFDDISL